MGKQSNDASLSQALSYLGLGLAIYAAVSPIFSGAPTRILFIDDRYATLGAGLAVLLSIIFAWLIFIQQRHFLIPVGGFKKRKRGWSYLFIINDKLMVMGLAILAMFCALGFFFLGINFDPNENPFLSLAQTFIYVLGFIFASVVTSLLITMTADARSYQAQRIAFPETIIETLARNGVIDPGVKILSKKQVNQSELSSIGITGQFQAHIVKVKIKQAQKVFLISDDGMELITELSSQEEETLEARRRHDSGQPTPQG